MTNEMAHSEIGDYTYLENMSIEAWAWEFTRRNADYREAWKNHVSRISADGKTVNNVIELQANKTRSTRQIARYNIEQTFMS